MASVRNNGRSKSYLIPNKSNPFNDWKWNSDCRPGTDLQEAIKFYPLICESNGATLWNHCKKFLEILNEIKEQRNLRKLFHRIVTATYRLDSYYGFHVE